MTDPIGYVVVEWDEHGTPDLDHIGMYTDTASADEEAERQRALVAAYSGSATFAVCEVRQADGCTRR
jgi:hypothetical protein